MNTTIGTCSRPYGDSALLERARDLCKEIEKLPPGLHQSKLSGYAADIAFALQQLQQTGDHYWPHPSVDGDRMLRERKVFIGAIRRLLDKWEADAYAYDAA